MSSTEKEAGVVHTSVSSLLHLFSAYLHLVPCLTLCQTDVAVCCLGIFLGRDGHVNCQMSLSGGLLS